MTTKLYFLTLLLLGFATLGNAQDAAEIIKKTDQKLRGESSKGTMTMKIIRPDWTREMSLKSWSKGDELALVLVTSPASEAGQATLKRDKEIWSWQPSIDKVVKLPPSMMSQSWMGSDFTNDDLVRESSMVKDYDPTLAGDTTIDGRAAWKIILTPKPDAAVVWGQIQTYIDKEEYIQLLVRFYDEDEYLVNTMIGKDIKEMGGRTIATKLVMIPAEKPGQSTEITYQNLEFNMSIEDNYFSIQNMKKVR